MLRLEVLISKLCSIDRLSTSTITLGKVASLEHEIRDHTVENRTLVVQRLSRLSNSLLSSAQSSKILSSLWNDVCIKFEHDPSSRSAISSNIKEDAWFSHG